VGKTTLAINLAFSFATSGWRTVLVDTDPQGAVGLSLTGPTSSSAGLAELVAGEASVEEVVLATRIDSLRIVPGGQLAVADSSAFEVRLRQAGHLAALLESLSEKADLVILDTRCGFGAGTLAAIEHADLVLSPLQAEPLSLKLTRQLLEVLADLREGGTSTPDVAFVINMLQTRESESLNVAEEAWARLPRELVLETWVPRDSSVMRANAAGVPVGLLSQRPPPLARVFDQLVLELESKLRLPFRDDDEHPRSLFA
jgi:chromosome partitioning protein